MGPPLISISVPERKPALVPGFWVQWQEPFRSYEYSKHSSHKPGDEELRTRPWNHGEPDLGSYLDRTVRPEINDFMDNSIDFYRRRKNSKYDRPKINYTREASTYRPYTKSNMAFEHFRVTECGHIPQRIAMYRHLHHRPISNVTKKMGRYY